jgi:crotonobetainyl-CoA:carnitine CoA-transferase CaiB-like acyl-CoA transferase
VTAVTPFGQTGPYKDYKAYPLNAFQSGGEGYLTPGESTYPDRPPLNLGKYVVEYDTAVVAAGATLVAYYWRLSSGIGQQVDISKQETMIFKAMIDLSRYVSSGYIVTRFTRGYRSGGMLPCKDGWVEFTPQIAEDWFQMFKLIGRPDLADDETLRNRRVREERAAEIKSIFHPWLMAHTKEEIYQLCQSNNISLAPVYRIDEVVNSKQLNAREFFVEIEHTKAGKFKYPSASYKFSETPWKVNLPAPLLGQHNEEIYCRRLGFTREDLVRLRETDII